MRPLRPHGKTVEWRKVAQPGRAMVRTGLRPPAASWFSRTAAITIGPTMPATDQAVSRRPWMAPTMAPNTSWNIGLAIEITAMPAVTFRHQQ